MSAVAEMPREKSGKTIIREPGGSYPKIFVVGQIFNGEKSELPSGMLHGLDVDYLETVKQTYDGIRSTPEESLPIIIVMPAKPMAGSSPLNPIGLASTAIQRGWSRRTGHGWSMLFALVSDVPIDNGEHPDFPENTIVISFRECKDLTACIKHLATSLKPHLPLGASINPEGKETDELPDPNPTK